VWHHKLLFNTRYQVLCDDQDFSKKIWEILESKYLTESIENHLHLKRRFYIFQLKRGISIGEHMKNYTKLLADLANVDVMIDEEDKALILLSSLPNDYEIFILTLIKVNNLLAIMSFFCSCKT